MIRMAISLRLAANSFFIKGVRRQSRSAEAQDVICEGRSSAWRRIVHTRAHQTNQLLYNAQENILNRLIAILSARLMKLLNSSRSCTVLFLLTALLWCALLKASESVVISSENEVEAD